MELRSIPHQYRIVLSLGAIYLLVTTLIGGLYLVVDHRQRVRLAKSYVRASRYNLMVRDLRQVVNALNPALGDEFTSISILDAEGGLLMGLPNDTAVRRNRRPLTLSISVPVVSDPSRATDVPLAIIVFDYSLAKPVAALALTAILWLLVLVKAYLVMQRHLLSRHEAQVAFDRMQTESQLAEQVAHDIRSPVTAITMVLDRAGEITASERDLLASAAARITDLADDLLTRYRTIPNRTAPKVDVQLDLRPVRIASLLNTLVEEARVRLERGITIAYKVDDAMIELRCLIDGKEFARAFSNILNNAVEAVADGGQVQVGLQTTADEVNILVADDGCGIPEEVVQRLGSERVSIGKEGTMSGSGLGLLHAKRLVNALGGRLVIQSRVGRGTLVTINLPRTMPRLI